MKNKKSIMAVIAVLLAATMVFGGCTKNDETAESETVKDDTASVQPVEQKVYSGKAGAIKKTETVYVNLDNNGKSKSVLVSDWIHTDKGEVAVSDISDLENIVNVKNDVKPEKDGNSLTWHMGTTDLYYQGNSSKELPVTIDIKYFLDGKEMTEEEIAGKSGNVKISIEMKNNVFTTKKIGGKDVKIYNPILAVGGTILSEGQFQNITVENGMSMGDGAKQFAVMMGFPGLGETLGMNNIDLGEMGEINFAQNFNITANVTDFSIGNFYFAAVPLSAIGAEIKIPESIGELNETLNKLKGIQAVITEIDPQNILMTMIQNPQKLTDIVSMVNSAVSLYKDNQALIELLSKYMTEENIKTITDLTIPQNGTSNLQEMVTLLSDPAVQKFLKLLPELSDSMTPLLPIMKELSNDLQKPEIQSALEKLPENIKALTELQNQLQANSETINQLTSILNTKNIDKITGLLDGIKTDDISKALEKYGIMMENADDILARASEMLKFGNEYKIFSAVPEGVTSSVMFVYQTPGIKVPTVEAPAQTAEELGWYQKMINKFKK